MADVFISYNHANRDAARILAEAISAEGFDVWWDRELVAGDNYTDVIEDILDTASAVIVVWSAASRKSYWVRDEAAVGRDRNRLLPVVIDDSLPPLGFRQIHTVSLKGWDGKDPSWLEDIFLGLKGLTGQSKIAAIPEEAVGGPATNPFGAPAEPARKADGMASMFAGVNAAPNQKPIRDIRSEEKRQRSFLKTFWLTSLGLAGIMSLILGLYANETDSFSGEHWLVNVIAASIFIGSGLIVGRFLIVVGRRLSKRKSVFYFDHPTSLCMAISAVLTVGLFLLALWDTEAQAGETLSDALFLAVLCGVLIVFPVSALVSLLIGAAKGRKRTSFEDGR